MAVNLSKRTLKRIYFIRQSNKRIHILIADLTD